MVTGSPGNARCLGREATRGLQLADRFNKLHLRLGNRFMTVSYLLALLRSLALPIDFFASQDDEIAGED